MNEIDARRPIFFDHAMDYALRPAARDDLNPILASLETPDLLKRWGGPALSFPPAIDRTWSEIEATDENTFSLVDRAGRLAGFGQTLCRAPKAIHLARLIVLPGCRGKGLGRLLGEQLMRSADERHHPQRFTLNVYKDNVAAVALYAALGFSVMSGNQHGDSCLMCLDRLASGA